MALAYYAAVRRGPEVRIGSVSRRDGPEGTVEAEIDAAGTRHRVRYSAPELSVDCAADALVAAALLPAMSTGATLTSEHAVSPRLLAALPTIQDIFRSWEQRYPVYGKYRRVTVDAPARPVPLTRPGRGTAAFFTAGVDSFYTAVRHRAELDALVYVCGFDVRAGETAPAGTGLAAKVLAGVRAAAEDLGIPLVVVDTDLRSFSDRYAGWVHYHGSALASVAHLLASRFAKVYIPASNTYAYLEPLGSHPLLDPLWSTEELEIVHDGLEAARLDKIEVIADEPAARTWLRVCWENRNGRYNCGSCEKCLRTMVAMSALGVLPRFEALPSHIDLRDVARVQLPDLRYTWKASLERLERTRSDPALARALRRRLYGRRARAFHRSVYYAHRLRSFVRR